MQIKYYCGLTLAALSMPAIAKAQDQCNAVLIHGIFDTTIDLTQSDKQERIARYLCSNSSSSSTDSVGLGYAGYTVNYGGARAKNNAMCEDLRSMKSLKTQHVNFVKTVSAQLIDAWSNCKKLAATQKGLRLSAQEEYDTNFISGTVKYSPTYAADMTRTVSTLSFPAGIRRSSCKFYAASGAHSLSNENVNSNSIYEERVEFDGGGGEISAIIYLT